MEHLHKKTIETPVGTKSISVYHCDIKELDEQLDILAVSAFYRSYAPTPGTMFEALGEKGINMFALAKTPEIDLRNLCNIWLSEELKDPGIPVGRIGCVEMSRFSGDRSLWKDKTDEIISGIRAFFRMLDIAALSGIKAEIIGLPILGSGSQQIDTELISIPILNECVSFLKQNERVREIKIIERNAEKAFRFAERLNASYSMQQETARSERRIVPSDYAFISYSSTDKNIADNLCAKLEASGIKVWYAPRDIDRDLSNSDYASAIVNGISRCTDFVVILSKNSLRSKHVLNEIDLAFQELDRGMRLRPLKIDEEELGSAFKYYLSRQHWMDAHIPPIEKRLDEFVELLCRRQQSKET